MNDDSRSSEPDRVGKGESSLVQVCEVDVEGFEVVEDLKTMRKGEDGERREKGEETRRVELSQSGARVLASLKVRHRTEERKGSPCSSQPEQST